MSRSLYKGPYVASDLLNKIKKMKEKGVDFAKVDIKTYSRKSTIIPSFVDYTFSVYNGKKFIKFYVTESMVGHKLGEFSHTRTFVKHSGDKKSSGTPAKGGKANQQSKK